MRKVLVVNCVPVAVRQLTPVMVFELLYDKWLVTTQWDVLCENYVMYLDRISLCYFLLCIICYRRTRN